MFVEQNLGNSLKARPGLAAWVIAAQAETIRAGKVFNGFHNGVPFRDRGG